MTFNEYQKGVMRTASGVCTATNKFYKYCHSFTSSPPFYED